VFSLLHPSIDSRMNAGKLPQGANGQRLGINGQESRLDTHVDSMSYPKMSEIYMKDEDRATSISIVPSKSQSQPQDRSSRRTFDSCIVF